MSTGRTVLSLCMIVRDEEGFLPQCLESVQGVVDETIIVDTGSTDRTVGIAGSFGARVVRSPWQRDFARARNIALDLARGEWILVLDADEALHPQDRDLLQRLLVHPRAEGFIVQVINYYGKKVGEDFIVDPVCRLFRNRPEYRYRGRIHEDIGGVVLNCHCQEYLERTNVRILHYGYLEDVLKARGKNRLCPKSPGKTASLHLTQRKKFFL